MNRSTNLSRKTNETDISLKLNIDGKGSAKIDTGIGFFNHMLELFAKHGQFDLDITAKGDIFVDNHHTVEDVGIVLGQAIEKALGDKRSIKRYGTSFVPMDDSLAMVSVDLSGRSYVVYDVNFNKTTVGKLETELIKEFFVSVANNAHINLHIKLIYGSNNHHIAESIFKAFGRALNEASSIDTRIDGILSTKGSL